MPTRVFFLMCLFSSLFINELIGSFRLACHHLLHSDGKSFRCRFISLLSHPSLFSACELCFLFIAVRCGVPAPRRRRRGRRSCARVAARLLAPRRP